MAIEQLGYNGPEGTIARGAHRSVIALIAARQLLAKESGSLVTLSLAAGFTVTLPTPVAGMQFDFFVITSATSSGVYKIITKTIASEFLLGGVAMASLTAGANDFFVADGTANAVSINLDATTKGGLIGGWLRFIALSTTQWSVVGVPVGSGTLADPFASS